MIIEMPLDAMAVYIFAHGAGAGMDHAFMQKVSNGLKERKIGTIRFNFPYMAKGRKAPGSPQEAMNSIKEVYQKVKKDTSLPIFAGGKSYGGRMTSQVVASGLLPELKGLVFFGFPLHAPGKPSINRAEHLNQIKIPMLFLQGSKDKLAEHKLIKEVTDKLKTSRLFEITDADHSFKVPKKAVLTQQEVYESMLDEVAGWIRERSNLKS